MEWQVFKGLKNTTSEERFTDGDLSVADGIDLDNTGKPQTRYRTLTLQGGSYHSLWADGDICLMVNAANNDLLRVNQDYSLTVLTRLSSGRRVSYKRLGNQVYLANGVDRLRIVDGEVRLWGTPRPSVQPYAAVTAGVLPAGRYQYAMTYRRADGQESGTGPAKSIELTSPGGIEFSSLESSTDPEVCDKLIYLSGPNGTELFRALIVPVSDDTAVFRGPFEEATIRLETQFASPPPAGNMVEIWHGTAFVVRGSAVYWSDPWALERFRLFTQFQQWPGKITLFAAVNRGIYVATAEKTWYMSGSHASKLEVKEILDYGAIEGTAVVVPETDLDKTGGSSESLAVLWATSRGVVVGREGGLVSNVTEKDYAFVSSQRGAGLVRQARGITQYLAALEGTGSAGNSY